MPIRVLHAGHMRQISIGVIRQMEFEQQAAAELGIDWISSFYCSKKIDSPVTIQTPSGNGLLRSKRDFYCSLLDRAANFDWAPYTAQSGGQCRRHVGGCELSAQQVPYFNQSNISLRKRCQIQQ